MDRKVDNHFPFVIVGAGISGLQAACNLAELGQSFVLLEAQDRIGGRICTLNLGEALEEEGVDCSEEWLQRARHVGVEAGGTWICEDNTAMLQLAKKHKVQLHPQFYEGKHILALSPKQRLEMQDYSEYYRGKQDKLVPLVTHLASLQSRYNYLTKTRNEKGLNQSQEVQLGEMYAKYDRMSGYDYIAGIIGDKFLADLVDNEVLTLEGISSKQFTALQLIVDDGSLRGLYYYLGFNKHNIDGYRANFGLKQLLVSMKRYALKELQKHNLPHQEHQVFRLSHPVATIKNDVSPVEVITEQGQRFTCGKVILAVPAGTMAKIQFSHLSEPKRLLIQNRSNSWCVRMTMVFPEPFWRYSKHSGNVNFSHEFPMNELVELSPPDLSCGIVAFVFFKEGFLRWQQAIDKEAFSEDEQQFKRRKHELNKTQCLQLLADLYLQGDVKHPNLQRCEIFTRSLSWNPYIKDSYDSTPKPTIYEQLYHKGHNMVEPDTYDEKGIIILGSDFCMDKEMPGYMEGAVRVANRKVNHCLLPKL